MMNPHFPPLQGVFHPHPYLPPNPFGVLGEHHNPHDISQQHFANNHHPQVPQQPYQQHHHQPLLPQTQPLTHLPLPNHHQHGHGNNINNNGQQPPPERHNHPWDYTTRQNSVQQPNPNLPSSRMSHGADPTLYHHSIDDEMLLDETDYTQFAMGYPEEDEIVEGMATPRAVHQCNICNKIFVSYKGLQQHAVIHTDQKPFLCDICSKAFRFKSNLFEHRSVHTGFTPHACPYCGKTCRLKGNLKKHLRTHVTTKEELEAAWRPFASNRRPPAEVPEDAIVVRGGPSAFYQTPIKQKKKKLGLGEPEQWVDKLRRGDILPQVELEDKINRLEDTIFNNLSLEKWSHIFEMAKSIAFETHQCPLCKAEFMTRTDCISHHTVEHGNSREGLDFFCEKCYRSFADEDSFNQHAAYHDRVHVLLATGDVDASVPDILIPTDEEFMMLLNGSTDEEAMDGSMI